MPVELPPDYRPSLSEDYMNPAQIEYFRRKLWESLADLRHELEALPRIEPDENVHEGDQSDQASADTDRSFDAINRARIQNLLHQIEQALVRLENGTYGFCEDTGEPIGLRRLMAQPATSLSLAAQQARERRAGDHPKQGGGESTSLLLCQNLAEALEQPLMSSRFFAGASLADSWRDSHPPAANPAMRWPRPPGGRTARTELGQTRHMCTWWSTRADISAAASGNAGRIRLCLRL